MEGLKAGLQELSGDGPEWWAAALSLVKKMALKFHLDQLTRPSWRVRVQRNDRS